MSKLAYIVMFSDKEETFINSVHSKKSTAEKHMEYLVEHTWLKCGLDYKIGPCPRDISEALKVLYESQHISIYIEDWYVT